MRVLHVVHTLDPRKGGSVETARTYAVMSSADCQIEVLSLDQDVSAWQAHWPVPVHAAGKYLTYYRFVPGLVRSLRVNSSYDAVVVHGIWHYHLPAIWLAFRESSVPYFVIPHGMLNPWFKRAHPLKHLKKSVFWHAFVRRAFEDAAAVLFLSEEEARLARQTFSFNPRGEAIVPLGSRIEPSSPELFLARFPELRSKRLLLFIGRICRMKGCDLLLEAFASAASLDPDLRLVFCGADENGFEASLKKRARARGVADRITWAGFLSNEMKWSAMNAADLFALPSRCETFPVSVLEALGCGLPVLITTDVNLWPTVHSHEAGIVAEARVESVALELSRWVKMSAPERREYRQRARSCFVRNYEIESAFQKHVNSLRCFMGQRRERRPADVSAA